VEAAFLPAQEGLLVEVATAGGRAAGFDDAHRRRRDVSLAGFDDIPLASSRILGLTTVAQHIDVMGKRAAEVMIQRLGQPEGSPPVQEVLEPERIVRATTGAAR